MKLKIFLILFVFAWNSACSDSPDDEAPAGTIDDQAQTAVDMDAAEVVEDEAVAEPEADAPVITAGESESAVEDEAEASADIVLAQANTEPAVEPSSRFVDGKHYRTLIPTQPTSSSPDKIEVAEVFMFSCPHCYNFEPNIQKWYESKASYIEFVRIPASFNSIAREHARAYYAAVQLGIADKIVIPFFREIHINRNLLNTADRLVEFFTQFDVSEEDFLDAFNSFEVDSKIRQADKLVRRYQVTGVPAVVVNGKYLSGAEMTGSYESLTALMDELAARENSAGN